MALNKAQTSMGVKVILIFLIIAFVVSFIPMIGNVFSNSDTQTAGQTGALDAINQQFQPTVASLTGLLQSEPESYTVLVNLGNTYFDWAGQVAQASQTSTAAVGIDQPLLIAAKDAYRRALAVKTGEPPVMIDYAIVSHYTAETSEAVRVAELVIKNDPGFAPAFYNLGVFYQAEGQGTKAIAAFEEYLKIDPEGTQGGGDPDNAKAQLALLKGDSATTTP